MQDVDTKEGHLLVRTECGRLFGWFSAGKLVHDFAASSPAQGSGWNSNFGNNWPSHVTPVDHTASSVDGMASDGRQLFVWGRLHNRFGMDNRLPFVLEPTGASLQLLELLLSRCCSQLDPQSQWPPTQDVECIAVTSLNLVRLQLQAISADEASSSGDLGLQSTSQLLGRLKSHVVSLACGAKALGAVQTAAQATLQQSCGLLLPTAHERAAALASLLKREDCDDGTDSGRKFMTDLLVCSLMADGGLQDALQASLLGQYR